MSEENYKISIKVEEALLDYMCDKYQHSFNCLDEYDQQLVDSIASLESRAEKAEEMVELLIELGDVINGDKDSVWTLRTIKERWTIEVAKWKEREE